MPFQNLIKKSAQTIFQGGSPWPTLIHNSMFVLGGPLLCPAASCGDFFQTFPLPLLKLIFFYFLSFFHLEFPEMQNFPKYMMPYYIPFTLSLAKAFFFCGISMGCLWNFWRGAMGILWYSYGIPLRFLWYFYDVSMVFLWGFYWIPVWFSRYFHDVSMIFLWDYYGNSYGACGSYAIPCYFYDLSMGFPWGSCGVSMVFLWYFLGATIGFLWGADGISMGFLWVFKRMSMGFPLGSHGISMMFLWYF